MAADNASSAGIHSNLLTGAGALVECMRPGQWIKNGFVLAPLLFSSKLSETASVARELAAVVAFCMGSSAVYLLNDSLDWREDQAHPVKRSRPIPSGRLKPVAAGFASVVLMLFSLLLGFLLGQVPGLILCAYLALNVAYSLRLKHVVITDMMCLAIGFVLRVIGGAQVIHVEASHWLLMCMFLLALFLAIGKRRHEVILLGGESATHRKVLSEYTVEWLDQAATLLAGATVVAYALYTVATETQTRFGTDRLIYTLPFVVYGILRYLHLIHRGERNGNPSTALTSDWQLLTCVGGWAVSCAVIIYF